MEYTKLSSASSFFACVKRSWVVDRLFIIMNCIFSFFVTYGSGLHSFLFVPVELLMNLLGRWRCVYVVCFEWAQLHPWDYCQFFVSHFENFVLLCTYWYTITSREWWVLYWTIVMQATTGHLNWHVTDR